MEHKRQKVVSFSVKDFADPDPDPDRPAYPPVRRKSKAPQKMRAWNAQALRRAEVTKTENFTAAATTVKAASSGESVWANSPVETSFRSPVTLPRPPLPQPYDSSANIRPSPAPESLYHRGSQQGEPSAEPKEPRAWVKPNYYRPTEWKSHNALVLQGVGFNTSPMPTLPLISTPPTYSIPSPALPHTFEPPTISPIPASTVLSPSPARSYRLLSADELAAFMNTTTDQPLISFENEDAEVASSAGPWHGAEKMDISLIDLDVEDLDTKLKEARIMEWEE